jgi:hypothetical protein
MEDLEKRCVFDKFDTEFIKQTSIYSWSKGKKAEFLTEYHQSLTDEPFLIRKVNK